MTMEHDQQVVLEAVSEAGYDGLDEFLLAQTGATLKEMAKELDVQPATFIRVHNAWVSKNAPYILPE